MNLIPRKSDTIHHRPHLEFHPEALRSMTPLRILPGLLALALAFGMALGVGAASTQAAPLEAGYVCRWESVLGDTRGRFHLAGALDSDHGLLVHYGGLGQSGDVSNLVGAVDLSDPNPNKVASLATRSAGLERFGAAGAYRGGPGSAVSADQKGAYFLGGSDDETQGEGEASVIFVPTLDGKIGAPSSLNPTGSLGERIYAAAAYDPASDTLWVTGGIKNCAAADRPCQSSNIQTKYLSWDATSGAAMWNNGPGSGVPNTLYGHTMIYDSLGQRLLVFGGSKDGARNERDVYALDLSGGPATAGSWSKLATQGSAPSLSFHVATFDASNNRMLVTGGAASAPQSANENANRKTYALELAATPTWQVVTDGDAEMVGGVAVWSTVHGISYRHGGRARFKDSGNQNVSGDTAALICREIPDTPTPVVTPGGSSAAPVVCSVTQRRVPPVYISAALASPDTVSGYGEPCYSNLPPGPLNPPRRNLAPRNPNLPFHPLFNPLVWKCGCS
jgi:hypothetical protein